jgi:tetratricopeptide (TPR) repeat protein
MPLRARLSTALLVALVAITGPFVRTQSPTGSTGDQLWHHRNLGKAFYENPTTQQQAVDEFKKALDLAPTSTREQLNYGLALLRAAKTADAIAVLQKVQQQDPAIPHTWFNLGIAYKKDSQYEKAIAQFEQMVKLAPNEPISHYNLGYLYKLNDKPAEALKEFERAAQLDPNLAGPHFQLFNAYREAGRADEAQREQQTFQDIKRRQAGAAIPEDLDWSAYAEILDTLDPALAADPSAPATLKFTDRKPQGTEAGAGADRSGLLVVDADADGRPDLIVWSPAGVRVFKNGETALPNAALAEVRGVRSIAAGDYNNDGFADLCIVADDGASLYANARGTFAKAATTLPPGSYAKAVWVDYDHDYDADLILVGDSSKLLRNNGQAGFSDQTADFPFAAGRAVDATAFDFINDTSGHDVVVSYADHAGVVYRDLLAGKYRAEPAEALTAGARSILAQDIDYDGWLDLVAASPAGVLVLLNKSGHFEASVAQGFSPAGAAPVAQGFSPAKAVALADFENRAVADLVVDGGVARNQGLGRFGAPQAAVAAGIVAQAVADFDADGKDDLAALTPDGALHVFHNDTATTNGWLRVTLTGVKNPKLAPEAQVEVKSGSRYQKKTYTGTPITFGLRDVKDIDTVRITWPNGLIQNELKQPINQAIVYKEAQRLSGSCPMIFTWDGHGYRFITDVLGVAPLGASSGDGTYFPVDHDEYVQIPGDALVAKDGRYDIRVTEELREVSYLDQIQLIAVDHPKRIDLFTNDKFKSPPFPEFRLFGAAKRAYPVAAKDGKGRDMRATLLAKDRTYAGTFSRDYAGVAELHSLDLDFGAAAADNKAALILSGWVDWADGSTFLGVSQEDPRGLIFPSIQVQDGSGKWVTVVEDMGIPAGKPKTIAVDLTGKFLSASRKVRIVTNLALYWDEIFLTDTSDVPPHVMTHIDASLVDLHYRGFSTPTIHPQRTQPEAFDYARLMPLSMWNPTPGLYTRYGDVTPLLSSVDDRLVIMGSGDEIRLLFPAAGLPPLESGWTRDFLLLVDGWAKDADANTAFSQTVEPLPFHTMSAYPYPAAEHFPDDALHRAYRERYNTRPALRLLRPLTTTQSEP